MAGFDCEFVEKPAEVLQTHCPVCLLVLREPYQAECCGKSFCEVCLKEIKVRNRPCPACRKEGFKFCSDKSLREALYVLRVFCSNKESGCAWEGELGQLDQHINSNPDKEKQLVGCGYTDVACSYCEESHWRKLVGSHQASVCRKRPFTCGICEEYKSTYDDIINSHAPVCKSRHVECPNSCGADNLQHQHLEAHVSSQCPLTLVECEFSEAGCAAKVYRKDLPSHLTDNIVTHMSLLAKENRKLRLELQERKESELHLKKQCEQLRLKTEKLATIPVRYLPLDFFCPAKPFQEGKSWSSEAFYSHTGGCSLQIHAILVFGGIVSVCAVRQAPEAPSSTDSDLKVSVELIDQQDGAETLTFEVSPSYRLDFRPRLFSAKSLQNYFMKGCYVKDNHLLFRVTSIDSIL